MLLVQHCLCTRLVHGQDDKQKSSSLRQYGSWQALGP
jgi:hypothetical protein